MSLNFLFEEFTLFKKYKFSFIKGAWLYFRFSFQPLYPAWCFIIVTIFSSSTKSTHYIIAVLGMGTWYVLSDKKCIGNSTAGIHFCLCYLIIKPIFVRTTCTNISL